MNLYGAVLLAFILNGNCAAETTTPIAKVTRANKVDAAAIAKLIYLVNQNKDNDRGDILPDKFANVEVVAKTGDVGAGDKKASLLDLMRLTQKNYDAGAAHAHRNISVRVHVIRNPEILQLYQQSLKKEHRTSSSDEKIGYELPDARVDLHPRRNAVFRLDTSSENNAEQGGLQDDLAKEGSNLPVPIEKEDDNINADLKSDIKKDPEAKLSAENVSHEKRNKDANAPTRKSNSDDDSNKQDTWDIITKKYDWDDKLEETSKNIDNDDNNNNEWENNEKGSDIKKKDKSNRFESKSNSEGKSRDSWDSWTPKGDISTQESWNKRDKKLDDSTSSNNKRMKEDQKDLQPNDDHWDNGAEKNIDWNSPNIKNNDWDEPKPKKNDRGVSKLKNSDWDNSKPKKKYWDDSKSTKNDWDYPLPNKNDWDNPKPKKIDWDDPKPKKNNWDAPNPIENDWGNPKPKKSVKIRDYNNGMGKKRNRNEMRETTHRKITTKDWDNYGERQKNKFAPKLNMYKDGPKSYDHGGGGGGFKNFGRTSIPFVGKHGIYEEK